MLPDAELGRRKGWRAGSIAFVDKRVVLSPAIRRRAISSISEALQGQMTPRSDKTLLPSSSRLSTLLSISA